MCELGTRLQRLYEYRQLRERWAQMSYLELKSSRMAREEAGQDVAAEHESEEQAYQDWKRARLDFEAIHLIWDAAQRLDTQAVEEAKRKKAA